MTNSDLVGIVAAAEELHVDRSTLTRWIRSGKASAIRLSDAQTAAYVLTRGEIERLKAAGNGAAA